VGVNTYLGYCLWIKWNSGSSDGWQGVLKRGLCCTKRGRTVASFKLAAEVANNWLRYSYENFWFFFIGGSFGSDIFHFGCRRHPAGRVGWERSACGGADIPAARR